MYETFVERTDAGSSRGLTQLLRANPVFTIGCSLLLFLVIGALYGLLMPRDRYANESKLREEYANPPTLRSYVLVRKIANRMRSDFDTGALTQARSLQTEAVGKWGRKPSSYEPQSGETIFSDKQGERVIFSSHLFGTDSEGRDVLLRTLVSTRVYVLPTLIAIGFSVLPGILLGILGADIWTGSLAKTIRWLAQCLMDVFEAMPKYITILLVVIFIPHELRSFEWHGIHWHGFYWLSIVLGILSAPKLGKLIMERIDILKKREFIEAAVAMGMSRFRVASKHVLRYNCLPLFLTQAAALMTDVILIEIILSYLADVSPKWARGITVASPDPSWGNILVDGRHYLFEHWWINLFPLLMVLLWISVAYMVAYGLSRILAQQRASTELW